MPLGSAAPDNVAPEKYPAPPQIDRGFVVRPVVFSGAPTLTPEVVSPERLHSAWSEKTDRSLLITPVGPASQVVVVPQDPLASVLPERAQIPAWIDRTATFTPALQATAPAVTPLSWDPELPGARLVPAWRDYSRLSESLGPAAQVVVVPKAPLQPILPDRAPIVAQVDRSAILLPAQQTQAAPILPVSPVGPERAMQAWAPEKSALTMPQGPASQLVGPLDPPAQIGPERYPQPSQIERGGIVSSPLQPAAPALPIVTLPASIPLRATVQPERTTVVWPIGQGAVVPVAPVPLVAPERMPPAQWVNRTVITIAPVQPVPAPLLSWTAMLLDRYVRPWVPQPVLDLFRPLIGIIVPAKPPILCIQDATPALVLAQQDATPSTIITIEDIDP